MKFFDPEQPFGKLLSSLADLMLLNLCWILLSLPLFTMGAASTAAYAVLGKRRRGDRGSVISEFWKAFRENFCQATVLWLIQVLLTLLLALGVWMSTVRFDNLPVLWVPVLWVCVAGLVAVTAVWVLVYPQLARFQNTGKATVKNALLLAPAKAGWVIGSLILFAIPVALLIFWRGAFLRFGFVWPLFGFAALFFFSDRLLCHALSPLEPKEDAQ